MRSCPWTSLDVWHQSASSTPASALLQPASDQAAYPAMQLVVLAFNPHAVRRCVSAQPATFAGGASAGHRRALWHLRFSWWQIWSSRQHPCSCDRPCWNLGETAAFAIFDKQLAPAVLHTSLLACQSCRNFEMQTRNSWTQTPTRRARLMRSRIASEWCHQEVWQASVWHQISAALTSMSSDGASRCSVGIHEFSWTQPSHKNCPSAVLVLLTINQTPARMSSLHCAQLRGRPGQCRPRQRGAYRSWLCCQAQLDCHLYDLRNQLVSYKQGWQWQKQLLDARLQAGATMPGVLLLLQHPSVYTLGEFLPHCKANCQV